MRKTMRRQPTDAHEPAARALAAWVNLHDEARHGETFTDRLRARARMGPAKRRMIKAGRALLDSHQFRASR